LCPNFVDIYQIHIVMHDKPAVNHINAENWLSSLFILSCVIVKKRLTVTWLKILV